MTTGSVYIKPCPLLFKRLIKDELFARSRYFRANLKCHFKFARKSHNTFSAFRKNKPLYNKMRPRETISTNNCLTLFAD